MADIRENLHLFSPTQIDEQLGIDAMPVKHRFKPAGLHRPFQRLLVHIAARLCMLNTIIVCLNITYVFRILIVFFFDWVQNQDSTVKYINLLFNYA